jgi:hypothetical protein
MQYRRVVTGVFAAGLVAMPLASAQATPVTDVYGDDVPSSMWSGETRSVANGGLVTAEGTSGWDDASMTWDISPVTGGFNYKYTFDNFLPAISHITLDLSDNAIDNGDLVDPEALTDVQITVGDTVYDAYDPAEDLEFATNFDNEAVIGGVKFDNLPDPEEVGPDGGSLMISFNSNRIPVWHDIEIEKGQAGQSGGPPGGNGPPGFGDPVLVRNSGFGPDNFGPGSAYIAGPNAESPPGGGNGVIPAPSAALGGLGLMSLAAMRATLRRRREPEDVEA